MNIQKALIISAEDTDFEDVDFNTNTHYVIQVCHNGKEANIWIPYAIFEQEGWNISALGLNLITKGHYI
jgi:hypothetical protein